MPPLKPLSHEQNFLELNLYWGHAGIENKTIYL